MTVLTDKEITKKIAGLTGEKVTEAYMDSRIHTTKYFILHDTTTTICTITLDCGYNVLGESACVDPENFDADIGQTLAYKDAYRKLWPLFGFLLSQKRLVDKTEIKITGA